jgi:hypothetical protein
MLLTAVVPQDGMILEESSYVMVYAAMESSIH